MRHCQDGGNGDAADEKSMVRKRDAFPKPEKQKAAEEWEEKTGEADENLVGGQAEPSDDGVSRCVATGKKSEPVEIQTKVDGQTGREPDEDAEADFRETTDDDRIENVGYIFPQQRPGRSVERVDLLPSAYVHRGRSGEHQAAEQDDYESFPPGSLHYEREKRSVAEVEPECTYEGAHYDHRLESYQSPQIEVPLRHAPPAVVVGISDDEARQDEKEVDGEIAVVYYLVAWAG